MPEEDRLKLVRHTITAQMPACREVIDIREARTDGQVIARLQKPLLAGVRGTLLLDLEACLKAMIDEGISIWLEPLNDRSSLRGLRGIEVKG